MLFTTSLYALMHVKIFLSFVAKPARNIPKNNFLIVIFIFFHSENDPRFVIFTYLVYTSCIVIFVNARFTDIYRIYISRNICHIYELNTGKPCIFFR